MVGYLVKVEGMGVDVSVEFVKQRRKGVKINKGFVEQLRRWEEVVKDECRLGTEKRGGGVDGEYRTVEDRDSPPEDCVPP